MTCRVTRLTLTSLLAIALIVSTVTALGQDTLNVSRMDSSNRQDASSAILGSKSEESRTARQSDLFVLTLTQWGRLYGTAYRGMHPGFLQYQYLGYQFKNPVNGFWNEQLLPHYRIADRSRGFGEQTIFLSPADAPASGRPESRVVFSQDFVYGINFFDADLNWRLSENSFLQLGGTNFTGDGSELISDYGPFKNNNYTVRYHRTTDNDWSFDAIYWQLRNRFRMAPTSGVFSFGSRDKFQQIEHLTWLRIEGRLGQRSKITIVPGYHISEDRYWRGSAALRDNRYHIYSLRSDAQIDVGSYRLGATADARHSQLDAVRTYIDEQTTNGEFSVYFQKHRGALQFSAAGGIAQFSNLGASAIGHARLSQQFANIGRLHISASRQQRPVPLLWQALRDPDYDLLKVDEAITEDQLSAGLSLTPGGRFNLSIEPFLARSRNYPQLFLPDSINQWQERSLQNRGVRIKAGLRLGPLFLEDDFTYSDNYQNALTPKFNNSATARLSIRFFKTALNIDGILSLRTFDYYEILSLDRLSLQYRSLDQVAGPINIADFRIQSYFRDAVVFVIFENFLSQDYNIEDSTLEQFRIFRLGVDWLFFN